MADAIFKKLAGMIGVGNSERLATLWSMVCDADEAAVLVAMPGTVEALAAKTGKSAPELEAVLGVMFKKGVAFEQTRDGVTTWARPKNLLQFHDGTLLWPDAPAGFIDLWKEFMDEEYPAFINMLKSAGMGPFVRVVPVNKYIEDATVVLPYENASKMIDEATSLAVTPCTCRVSQRKCDYPVEVCLQINKGADYALKRGTGRALTKAEAHEILDIAEKAGLIHISENRAKIGNVICNCCPCCCMAVGPMLSAGAFAAPSRFAASVDASSCDGCTLCEPRCHAGAIAVTEGIAAVDPARCIGCGLCASVCPPDAIKLKESRPAKFIP